MKKILLLTLPLMAMCFASCEKENGNVNDGPSGQKLVKEITWIEDDYLMARTYEYDSQYRIIKMIEALNGVGVYETTVEYNGNTIVESFRERNNDGWSNSQHYAKHYLDNDGYVVKSESISISDGRVVSSTTYEYENGYLKTVKESNSDFNTETEYEWLNGDIVREDSREYQYLDNDDKTNIDFLNTSVSISYAGIRFKGTCSRHLMSRYSIDSQGTEWINTTYEFDADGYPIIRRDISKAYTMEVNITYY